MQCKIKRDMRIDKIILPRNEICGRALERATACVEESPPIVLVDDSCSVLHGSRYIHAALDLGWESYPVVLICITIPDTEKEKLTALDDDECDCCNE